MDVTRRLIRVLLVLALPLVAPWAAVPRAAAEDRTPAADPKIAGLLPVEQDLRARWPGSGVWVFPVGDSLDFATGSDGDAGYRVNRGVQSSRNPDGRHDGADLANGSAGGRVRAAAGGIVVSAECPSSGGYGCHVVIAHHLDDGDLVYTVYAHLATGSTRVETGATVVTGEPIARVGQTGRATTPHLHFEVRVPDDSTRRWENCAVVDPMAFVRKHLPGARPDTGWAAPYLAWAELSGLVPNGLEASTPVDAALLAQVLERCGVPASAVPSANVPVAGDYGPDVPPPSWTAIAHSLSSLNARRPRLPHCPVARTPYSHACRERLGVRRPAHELGRLAGRKTAPTLGELCLVLADFSAHPKRRKAASAPSASSR